MADDLATRGEVNGLGNRLSALDKSVAGCQATNAEKLRNMGATLDAVGDSNQRLCDGQAALKNSIVVMRTQIVVAVAVIVLVVQVFAPIVFKLWGKG